MRTAQCTIVKRATMSTSVRGGIPGISALFGGYGALKSASIIGELANVGWLVDILSPMALCQKLAVLYTIIEHVAAHGS